MRPATSSARVVRDHRDADGALTSGPASRGRPLSGPPARGDRRGERAGQHGRNDRVYRAASPHHRRHMTRPLAGVRDVGPHGRAPRRRYSSPGRSTRGRLRGVLDADALRPCRSWPFAATAVADRSRNLWPTCATSTRRQALPRRSTSTTSSAADNVNLPQLNPAGIILIGPSSTSGSGTAGKAAARTVSTSSVGARRPTVEAASRGSQEVLFGDVRRVSSAAGGRRRRLLVTPRRARRSSCTAWRRCVAQCTGSAIASRKSRPCWCCRRLRWECAIQLHDRAGTVARGQRTDRRCGGVSSSGVAASARAAAIAAVGA